MARVGGLKGGNGGCATAGVDWEVGSVIFDLHGLYPYLVLGTG
jgi:hypothetical protein